MELKGKIVEIFDTQNVSSSFKKREFVVEYADNPSYPELISFQLIQDKCDILDNFKVNDEVVVAFNLKGRRWESPQGEIKYFNSLQAWRIQKESAQANVPSPNQAPDFPPPPAPDFGSDSNDDALPF